MAVFEAGYRIGNYEVVRSLGAGGQGVVYLCRHVMLDRLDAVKVLLAHHAGDAEARQRFEREAAAAARLRHPNIVSVYDAGTVDNGDFYVAMQFIDGASLERLISSTGIADLTRALRILDAIANALDAAHAVGLVHRDVKPNNILLSDPATPGEHAYLADFGVAKLLESRDGTLSQVMGTYGYMAPERIDGESGDGSADQYALACTAFQCLTGSLPFPDTTTSAVIKAHVMSPPPDVTGVRADLPSAANDIFARAMAKAPSDRYPSCAAFVSALRSALDSSRSDEPLALEPKSEPFSIALDVIGDTVVRPRAGARTTVKPKPVHRTIEDVRPEPVADVPSRRKRTLFLAAAALVVVGILVTVGFVVGPHHTKSAGPVAPSAIASTPGDTTSLTIDASPADLGYAAPVTGTGDIPAGSQLWIFVHIPGTQILWFSTSSIATADATDHWTSACQYFGKHKVDPGSHGPYDVYAVVVPIGDVGEITGAPTYAKKYVSVSTISPQWQQVRVEWTRNQDSMGC